MLPLISWWFELFDSCHNEFLILCQINPHWYIVTLSERNTSINTVNGCITFESMLQNGEELKSLVMKTDLGINEITKIIFKIFD